ncbi:aldehyde dehydrogenase family protein [Streptomyces phyllanthi]|uniref:Aldehyde dehydrogenase family protein n=1 Tax=Streptomyces phyllanthi TaxID=1803180 RepID=A0A5N8W6J2_9ACTN|nr:aldehyde dehydrogenase family protein [Streptomyces phyllanthi]
MLRMTERVQAGTIWGNTMRLYHPGLWFGGMKASGQGSAYAEGTIEDSTRVRRVTIRFDEAAPTPAWPDLDGDGLPRRRLPLRRIEPAGRDDPALPARPASPRRNGSAAGSAFRSLRQRPSGCPIHRTSRG